MARFHAGPPVATLQHGHWTALSTAWAECRLRDTRLDFTRFCRHISTSSSRAPKPRVAKYSQTCISSVVSISKQPLKVAGSRCDGGFSRSGDLQSEAVTTHQLQMFYFCTPDSIQVDPAIKGGQCAAMRNRHCKQLNIRELVVTHDPAPIDF